MARPFKKSRVFDTLFRCSYSLACVFKKRASGISTPKKEMDLVRERLKRAELIYEDWKKGKTPKVKTPG